MHLELFIEMLIFVHPFLLFLYIWLFLFSNDMTEYALSFLLGMISSGKTYTMVGTRKDPGLMVLSLNTIFDLIRRDKSSDEFEVTCSYLEVYNEVGCPFSS